MQEPKNKQKPPERPKVESLAVPSPNTRKRMEITFPEQLPVSAQRKVIAEALLVHQVVIVCGETG